MFGLAILLISLFRSSHPFWSILGPPQSNLDAEPHHQWTIEVKGLVRSPGIYTFDKPPTVYQAIQTAGGLVGENCLSFDMSHNVLNTGMRVEVRKPNGDQSPLIIAQMGSRERYVLAIPIDLNTAAVEDLVIIPGISRRLAERIVAFRESHGPFKTWDALRRVKGIGPKKVESLRYCLSLN
jgi:competence protein ComEA